MTYTVKKGDTLSAIATRYNTTVSEIAKLNNIKNVNIINIGQVLTLPDGNAKPIDCNELGKAVRKCAEDIQRLPSFAKVLELI